MSFNILLDHIPDGAKSAADCFSLMQTDPTLSLQMKLADHVPIHEIEIETEARAADVSLSIVSGITQFSDCLPNLVGEKFNNQLKAHHRLYDNF